MKIMRVFLAVFLFFIWIMVPSELIGSEKSPFKCLDLDRYGHQKLCGDRSIFKNEKDLYNIISIFHTLSATPGISLPPVLYAYVAYNKEMKTFIFWVSEYSKKSYASYAMGVGDSFSHALQNCIEAIKNRSKEKKPIVVPRDIEKCFGANPQPCA